MKTLTDRALEADQVHCAASAEFAGATFVDRPAAERIHSEGDPGRQLPPQGKSGRRDVMNNNWSPLIWK